MIINNDSFQYQFKRTFKSIGNLGDNYSNLQYGCVKHTCNLVTKIATTSTHIHVKIYG